MLIFFAGELEGLGQILVQIYTVSSAAVFGNKTHWFPLLIAIYFLLMERQDEPGAINYF